MFTGIVERSAKVVGVAQGPKFVRLTLACDWSDVKLGDSVAVNGVCLTVAEITPRGTSFDVIAETLSRTNLGLLKSGDEAHVERAMRIGDRVDGHFVQGHVDGPAILVSQVTDEREWRLTVRPPMELMKYVAPKGSVALDGVSLTVAAVWENSFEVALIPTTVKVTALAARAIGWPYNLEADVISKTVVHYLEQQHSKRESDAGEG
jgi:riboflavin synthase